MPDQTESASSASSASFSFPDFDYLIDELLPSYEVHLVGGPTGAGKTSWLLAMLDSWRQGLPLFGFASRPVPFIYLSLDRSRNGMLRILKRMHLPDPRPLISSLRFPTVAQARLSVPQLLSQIHASDPAASLIVVEGFQFGVRNKSDNREVTDYLNTVRRWCEKERVTVLGVVATSKVKQNQKYENPRERISGCMEWGQLTETVIMVEPKTDASGVEASLRQFQLLPRNAVPITQTLEFRDGKLMEQLKPLTNEQKIMHYCLTRPAETDYSVSDLRAVTGVSEAQLYRVIDAMLKTGRLAKTERGIYRFVPSTGTN